MSEIDQKNLFNSGPIVSSYVGGPKSKSKPPSSTEKKQPGQIRTEAQMTIHSRFAHAFFYGRLGTKQKAAITGLVRFGHNVKYIWDMAATDDPYADEKLLEIEAAINDASEAIREKAEYIDELLSDMGNIIITADSSVEPIKLPLSFRTPYGFMGARLLTDFDTLMLKTLSALHVGLLVQDDMNNIAYKPRFPGSKIRNVFRLSSTFKASSASRDDFASNNARAREALVRLGKLDEDILSGKRRPKFVPRINSDSLREQFDNKDVENTVDETSNIEDGE